MISGSITLLSLAPLTNIAVALMLDPSFGVKLKNCVMMGGNYSGVLECFLFVHVVQISFIMMQSVLSNLGEKFEYFFCSE